MLIADPPAILSESEIDVTVEPPGPFVFVPDIVLQAVGNAGLYQALSTLQVQLLQFTSIACIVLRLNKDRLRIYYLR